MENFLRGHPAAFQAWGGAPWILLYDNLKSAVLDAIRFHPTLLATPSEVRVVEGTEILACHPRSYDKGRQIEIPPMSRRWWSRNRPRGLSAAPIVSSPPPNSRELLTQTAQRGYRRTQVLRLHGLIAYWSDIAEASWLASLIQWEE